MKITQIKVMAGKDIIIFEPASGTWVIAGKSGELPEKVAKKLFKEIAKTAEQYFELLYGAGQKDFR